MKPDVVEIGTPDRRPEWSGGERGTVGDAQQDRSQLEGFSPVAEKWYDMKGEL